MKALFISFCWASIVAAQDDPLGKLSERYESGGRGPSTVSSGKNDNGGVSYGSYQLASMTGGKVNPNGSAARFAKKYYPESLALQSPGSPEFTAIWKDLAKKQPEVLKSQEHEFIFDTHYLPQKKQLEKELSIDLDKRSHALRDAIWSTAVHHGPRTRIPQSVAEEFTKGGKSIADLTDEVWIVAIYDERGRKDDNGKLKYFKRYMPGDPVMNSLVKRFVSEKADALKMLEDERKKKPK